MVFTRYFLSVADVEVKGDGVFIRLRKEEVVCEDKDSSKEVSSDVSYPVVEKVPEIGSEVAIPLEAIPEDFSRKLSIPKTNKKKHITRLPNFCYHITTM